MSKKYLVEVPPEVGERLNKSGPLSMHIGDQQLIIRPDDGLRLIPQLKFWTYGGSALGLALAFLAAVKIWRPSVRTIPWAGEVSISGISVLLSLVSGVLTFAVAFCRLKWQKRGAPAGFTWRSLIPLVVACAMIIALVGQSFGWLVDQLFSGLRIDVYSATAMVFVGISITNYLMLNLAHTLSPGVVINLITGMTVGGVGLAMMTNSQKDWWHYNFSFLGTAENSNAWQFNVTLIFAGLLMMTLVDYLFVNLRKEDQNKRTMALRLLLLALAACIAGIGFFPNDPKYHWLHDQIAMWLVYILWILIIAVRWCLPAVTKEFLQVSYLIGGSIAVVYILFQFVHYLSLTAFELFAFALAFAWILLLFQYIENLLPASRRQVPVRLVVKEG